MEVKRNVRMRRMERVKQLLGVETRELREREYPQLFNHDREQDQNQNQDHVHVHVHDIDFERSYKKEPKPNRDNPSETIQLVPYIEPILLDPRLQDPEYVWKQKYKKGIFNDKDSIHSSETWSERPRLRIFWIKTIICLFLFVMIWSMFQLKHPYAEKGKSYVINALSNPLEFDSVAVWFKQTFGDTPSFIPAFRSEQRRQEETIKASLGNKRTYFAPLQGYVTIPFEQSQTGVLLQTKTGSPVASFDEGQVVFVDTTDGTGLTVNIKHPNGVQSAYGWMEESRVRVNDWVKGGDTIGFASQNDRKGTGMLYFSIKLDKTYVNPVEVVSFD